MGAGGERRALRPERPPHVRALVVRAERLHHGDRRADEAATLAEQRARRERADVRRHARLPLTGYGFTAEPDWLYLLDRRTGRVVERLSLPSAPEKITRRGKRFLVRTYDHVLTVELAGVDVLGIGDRAPLEATIWRPPADATTIGDLLADGPILLLFYFWDWTST